MQVGVLALQGGFEPHARAFARLGCAVELVRRPEQLATLTHLTLPGGESTTLHHLLELFGLREVLIERHRAGRLALFGTCAGAILLGRAAVAPPPRMELLDIELERNAYGRQAESFTAAVEIAELGAPAFECVFIRAPKIRAVGRDVQVLAQLGVDPILVAQRGSLAATFHPELTDDVRLHALFLARASSLRASALQA